MRFLIVSDKIEYLKTVTELLERNGQNNYVVCANPKKATETRLKDNPDCVIFDREIIADYPKFAFRFSIKANFVAHSETMDADDAIYLLNTNEIAYYLHDPITDKQISSMLKSLMYRCCGSENKRAYLTCAL